MFRCSIETNNAAFADGNGTDEVARILRKLADSIEHGPTDGKLFDINGNAVGEFGFSTLLMGRG